MLKNKNIVIGVTSSIAAYKVIKLIKAQKANIFVIMTKHATKLVSVGEFEAASGNKVSVELFDPEKDYGSEFGIVNDFACAQPFQRIFISWDGSVFPCCEGNKPDMIMGNANDAKLINIWHCEKYNIIRNRMRNGTYYKIPLCNKCYRPHA